MASRFSYSLSSVLLIGSTWSCCLTFSLTAFIVCISAGLHLTCTDDTYEHAFEDECKLTLPYCIGAKGNARASDDSCISENQADHLHCGAEDRFADLYQPDSLPLSYMHETRLISIPNHWLGMVRKGNWTVGKDRVMGGIEEWKKADSEEAWDKYVIPPTW